MERSCSFCGIEESRVERLLLGPNVAICNVCVEACQGQLDGPYITAPEPQVLMESISTEMNWGPFNCNAAVRADFCCEYCGKRMLSSLDNYYSWELDHITPGKGDSPDDYALACHTCNHLKHHYLPDGATRDDRVADARRIIGQRRSEKITELQKLRTVVGLPELVV